MAGNSGRFGDRVFICTHRVTWGDDRRLRPLLLRGACRPRVGRAGRAVQGSSQMNACTCRRRLGHLFTHWELIFHHFPRLCLVVDGETRSNVLCIQRVARERLRCRVWHADWFQSECKTQIKFKIEETPMAVIKKSLVNSSASTKSTKSAADKAAVTAPVATSLQPTRASLKPTRASLKTTMTRV